MEKMHELSPGKTVCGKYLILREIGHGATSRVYLVRDLILDTTWALKLVGPKRGGSSVLKGELDRLKALSHPGLPRIVDFVETEVGPGMVMDYLVGETLDVRLQKIKTGQAEPFSIRDLLRWSAQLLDILNYLSNLSPPLVYRDLKPGNILLRRDQNVMLLDFGTQVHEGTPGYAAPEQFAADGEVDGRTDLYALGKTMLRLLEAVSTDSPGSGGTVRRGFCMVMKKACRSKPQDRYASAGEMKEAVLDLLAKSYGKRALPGISFCDQVSVSRKSILRAVGMGTAVLGVTALLMTVSAKSGTQTQPREAKEGDETFAASSAESKGEEALGEASREKSAERGLPEFYMTSDHTSNKGSGEPQEEEPDKKMRPEGQGVRAASDGQGASSLEDRSSQADQTYKAELEQFRELLNAGGEAVKDAEPRFRRLISLKPDRWDPYFYYISYFYREGDLKRATELLCEAEVIPEAKYDPNYRSLKIKLQNAGAL